MDGRTHRRIDGQIDNVCSRMLHQSKCVKGSMHKNSFSKIICLKQIKTKNTQTEPNKNSIKTLVQLRLFPIINNQLNQIYNQIMYLKK